MNFSIKRIGNCNQLRNHAKSEGKFNYSCNTYDGWRQSTARFPSYKCVTCPTIIVSLLVAGVVLRLKTLYIFSFSAKKAVQL